MLLCVYGLEQWTQAKSHWFYTHQTVTNYATGVLTLLAIAIAIIKHKPVFKSLPKEYWCMVGLFSWAFMSLIWSIDAKQSWEIFKPTIPFIVIFGLLAPLVVLDRGDLRAMLMTLLTLGFAISTLLLATTEWDSRSIVLEATLTFSAGDLSRGNPLAIAQLGSQVALAALLMNFRGVARFWQILRYVVFAVGFAVSVKSGSRGQAVGLLLLIVCLFPLSRRFKDVKGFIGFAVSVVIIGAITLMLFSALTAKQVGPERWTFDSFVEAYSGGRIATSLEVLGHWAAAGPHRWFVGLGSSASYKYLGIYPHVVAAEVLAELGFVGFTILGLFAYYAARTMKQLWVLVRHDDEDRGLVVALAGIFLFEVIMSFKQGALVSAGTMFATGITLARMLVFYQREVAMYEQLDAGGYAMTSDERADELDEIGEVDDLEAYPELEPSRA